MIEHIPGDMTVTVTGDVTLAALQGELKRRGQWLPIDPPFGGQSPHPSPLPFRRGEGEESTIVTLTIADLINFNASGPRRFGYGTIRDYLIGIKVALADGTAIHSGGKVVKNVAGYDLLKLFIGSRGSLGTVREGTFKLRPLPEREQFVQARAESLETADRLIEAIMNSEVAPVVLDLHNLENHGMDVVAGFAGTREEVEWQMATVRELGFVEPASLDYEATFWNDPGTVSRLSVLPSRVFGAIHGLGGIPFVTRAGNGVIYYRGKPTTTEHPPRQLRREKTFDGSILAGAFASGYGVPALAGKATASPGELKVLPTAESSHAPPPEGGTPYPDARHCAGSGVQCASESSRTAALMRRLKDAFDPEQILPELPS